MFSLITIPLGAFLTASVGYLALRVLFALGIGIIAYGSVNIVMELLFSYAQGKYNNIPSFALQILGLAGGGQALGQITGAITFRSTFNMMSKLGVIPKP